MNRVMPAPLAVAESYHASRFHRSKIGVFTRPHISTDTRVNPGGQAIGVDTQGTTAGRPNSFTMLQDMPPQRAANRGRGTMRLKVYQWGELIGILLLLGSTAAQMFYLEPLKREIEWRLVAFNTQQSAQIQLRALFDNQVVLLKRMGAPAEEIAATEARRETLLGQYKTSDANISDFMIEKERVESTIEVIVIALFALGSLLAGLGRTLEMLAARRAAGD
jgi:hypothetical protein